MQPEAYCFHKQFDPAGPAVFTTDRHYLLYALEGTLRLEAEGLRWTLPPARAAMIRAGEPVSIAILSRLTSASVLFAADFIPPPLEPLAVFDMPPLARELVRECRGWGAERAQPLPAYARQIFATLAAVVARLAERPSPCMLPAPKSEPLARALALTEAAAHEAPEFTAIARAAGQSPRALSRRFSTEMGMS